MTLGGARDRDGQTQRRQVGRIADAMLAARSAKVPTR